MTDPKKPERSVVDYAYVQDMLEQTGKGGLADHPDLEAALINLQTALDGAPPNMFQDTMKTLFGEAQGGEENP